MSHDTLWLKSKCEHCKKLLSVKRCYTTNTPSASAKMIANDTVFGDKRYHLTNNTFHIKKDTTMFFY